MFYSRKNQERFMQENQYFLFTKLGFLKLTIVGVLHP